MFSNNHFLTTHQDTPQQYLVLILNIYSFQEKSINFLPVKVNINIQLVTAYTNLSSLTILISRKKQYNSCNIIV